MSVTLNPYLSFRDEAREAMEFYRSVLGGELTLSTFADFGQGDEEAEADKIMHGQLTSEHLTLMGADTPNEMPYEVGTNFAVSLSGGPEDEETLRGYWEGLAEGGRVVLPLEPSPWGDAFGMLNDRFGVQWMVNIGQAAPTEG
ncbi:VOC family protein [Agromyces luteolus]|uniref:VOC family protein n=1 Tax=Agromyces luteolus TaxID=88373 RepID=A0A7C9LE88_9MICO|nr:VOC family protein [Agromyces luteolus]MUN07771.1 VOC family protein [Agromyces luteolus]GLK27543.1 VOC family protein [Agromyces luteolus]